MGCHTWCYKKERDISNEELIKEIIKGLSSQAEYSERYLYEHPSNKDVEKDLKNQLRILNLFKDGKISSESVISRAYNDLNRCEFLYHDGSFYKETEYHDIFRIGGYPEDMLTSFEETNVFIKENMCYSIDYERLVKFWEEYPEGLLEFG